MGGFGALVSDRLLLLERPNHRAVDQLFDFLGAEIFKQTNVFFNEVCRVHDRCQLQFFTVILRWPPDILDLGLIFELRSRPLLVENRIEGPYLKTESISIGAILFLFVSV